MGKLRISELGWYLFRTELAIVIKSIIPGFSSIGTLLTDMLRKNCTGKKRVESIFDLTIDYAIVACDLQLILT